MQGESSGVSTVRSGANLTVNLTLTFKPVFTGLKNVFMQTKDNATGHRLAVTRNVDASGGSNLHSRQCR